MDWPKSCPTQVPMQGVSVGPHYQLVPTRHGSMLVNRNDLFMGQSFLHYGECCQFEIDTLLQLLSHPQASHGLVIEAGSNMGVHTIALAQLLTKQNRPMLAFEPQQVIFQQLCANLALNALMNVTALPCACSSQPGTLRFDEPDYGQPGNFGGTALTGSPTAITHRTRTVPAFALDQLVATHFPHQPVALIKIDVEGHELQVLQGAQTLLDRDHPILYLENDRIEHSETLIRWLFTQDYRLWWHITPAFNPRNYLQNPENIYPNIVSPNMIALHPSRSITLQGLEEITDPTHHPLARSVVSASE